MPLPKEHIYTTKDIYELPEGQRAELIDGTIYDMAPPSRLARMQPTKRPGMAAGVKYGRMVRASEIRTWISP